MDQMEIALEGLGINQPFSIEAEQAVLGAAIIDPELVSAIVEQVRSEYFYVKQNRLIFNEILTLFMANTPSDFVTVVDAVVSAKIFSDENYLYIANLEGKYAFPLSSLVSIHTVKKRIRIAGWNKEAEVVETIDVH